MWRFYTVFSETKQNVIPHRKLNKHKMTLPFAMFKDQKAAERYLAGRYKTQVTGLQVTGHRSQVTENAIKKLDTLLGFLCLFICFISGYVTIRHMFGIDHASCCS